MVNIMASKLTSSLRKSISAEQESVEKKAVGTKKAPVRKPTAAKSTQSVAAEVTTTVAKEAPVAAPLAEKPIATSTPVKPTVALSIETPINPLDFMASLKELASGFAGKFELADFSNYTQGWGLVQEAIEKITATNHEVLSSCLDNLVEVNDEISDYVKSLLEAREPNEIYQLNADFIKTLQQKQQELFSKNLAVFNHFSGWKF